MTKLLEQAIAQVKQLPDPEQDAIAALILEELEEERLWDAQKRAIIQIIARIHKLGSYQDGWDGLDGKAPTRETVKNAEGFARLMLREPIHIPHISLATDGEINFFWNLANFRLDLGFFGDGTYSYYGENTDGREFMADDEPVNKPLPEEIIELLKK